MSTVALTSPLTQWLSQDFKPGHNEVIIGRGRKIQQHDGNLKLQALVKLKAKDYVENADKTQKSFIISEIGQRVREESQYGGFVKKDAPSGKWYVVSESCVRSTIAQAFRDVLSPNYRSSKFSKQRRRWTEKTGKETTTVPAVVHVTTSQPAPEVSLVKPYDNSSSYCPPLSTFSLQQAMRPVVRNHAMHPSFYTASMNNAGVSGTTSDILKNCLDLLGSETNEDWISYTDNPFEPNPIAEMPAPSLQEASDASWWV
jgi:hypothetical protein